MQVEGNYFGTAADHGHGQCAHCHANRERQYAHHDAQLHSEDQRPVSHPELREHISPSVEACAHAHCHAHHSLDCLISGLGS